MMKPNTHRGKNTPNVKEMNLSEKEKVEAMKMFPEFQNTLTIMNTLFEKPHSMMEIVKMTKIPASSCYAILSRGRDLGIIIPLAGFYGTDGRRAKRYISRMKVSITVQTNTEIRSESLKSGMRVLS